LYSLQSQIVKDALQISLQRGGMM